jgi:arsenical resistance protein ArsH
MNVLIFSGCLDKREHAISKRIANYLMQQLQLAGHVPTVYFISDPDIPLFDFAWQTPPAVIREMSDIFLHAEVQIWMTPLYHGSMTGAMKNCLDWLEVTRKCSPPYLEGKIIGLICWADGLHALQGVNAMDPVVKALRAWVLPFCVPIIKQNLFNDSAESISKEYKQKLDLMLDLLVSKRIEVIV